MDIADHVATRSRLAVRNYEGLIKLGCVVALAIIAIALLHFASSGPGVTEAEFATVTVGL